MAVSMNGTVNGKRVLVGGDQGAMTSIICKSAVELLGLHHKVEPMFSPITVKVGTGGFTMASELIRLRFELDGHPFEHTLLVVPNFSGLFLLGIDFFQKHGYIKPRFKRDYYVFYPNKKVRYEPHPLFLETDPVKVIAGRLHHVPVGCTNHVLGVLDVPEQWGLKEGDEAMIRPTTWSLVKGLEVPHMLVEVYAHGGKLKARVNLSNISSRHIRVPKGTVVGILSRQMFLGSVITEDAPQALEIETDDQCQLEEGEPPVTITDEDLLQHVKTMGLPEEREMELFVLLLKWKENFATNPRKPNINKLVEHHIDTGDAVPFQSKPYNFSPVEEEIIRKEILDMLDLGIIRPSSSPWSSSVFLAKQSGGKNPRFVMDARKLNRVTKKDSFTLPRLKDLMRRFQGAKFFSVVDAAAGFYGVPLSQDSMEKTAFITRFGLYEYTVMPFGLCNAPATYQRLMSLILGNLQWSCVCVYIDDAIVYSPTWTDHMKDLDAVMSRFHEAGISLKLPKCKFAQPEVRYLGVRLSGDGQSTDPDNIKKVEDAVAPINHGELRSFMGLINYYRHFVPNFADMAEPLLDLQRFEPVPSSPSSQETSASFPTQPKTSAPSSRTKTAKKLKSKCAHGPKPWKWTSVEQAAFDALKKALVSAPVLAYPDFTGEYPFILDTDASNVGLGAVLSQRYPDGDHPIGYYSYTLKPKERKWSTTEREAYAILKAVRYYRHILAGSPFKVVTDHASLRYLMGMKDPFGRIARWIAELQQYDFSIEQRPGKSHCNADALSRPPIVQPMVLDPADEGEEDHGVTDLQALLSNQDHLPSEELEEKSCSCHSMSVFTSSLSHQVTMMPTMEELVLMQQQDPVLRGYIIFLRDGSMDKVPADIKPLLVDVSRYALVGGMLHHIWQPAGTDRAHSRIVLPQPVRKLALESYHENILAGHRGFKGTYDRIRRKFYWPGLRHDVYEWVRSCIPCAERKKAKTGATSGMRAFEAGIRPFEAISIDYLGPLPETVNGNKYILVVNDYMTRFVCAFPTKTNDAEETADILVNKVFLEYGPPKTILSDRGSHFNNALVHAVVQLFQSHQVFSSGYRPQTAGITERMNATLEDLLAMYINDKQTNWDIILPYVLFAYRTQYSPVVDNVPFYLLFGYEPIMPHELPLLPSVLDAAENTRWNSIAQKLNAARKRAKEAVERAHATTQKRTDGQRKESYVYKYGDTVMVYKPHVPTGGSKKLSSRLYDGPFRVIKSIPGHRTLNVSKVGSGILRTVHVDNCKRYQPSDLREPIEQAPTSRPSDEAERRCIDMLERQCLVAKHLIGQGRARAIVEHILGVSGLPPLSPDLQQWKDQQQQQAKVSATSPKARAKKPKTTRDDSDQALNKDDENMVDFQIENDGPIIKRVTFAPFPVLIEDPAVSHSRGDKTRNARVEKNASATWKGNEPWHLATSHKPARHRSRFGRRVTTYRGELDTDDSDERVKKKVFRKKRAYKKRGGRKTGGDE